jgi:hypothetical protein
MFATQAPPVGANTIYRTGIETLVSQSPSILTGSVDDYSKKILSESQGGANAIPLKWIVSGRVNHPKVIKGTLPSKAVSFSRKEQSEIIPGDTSIAQWELDYGHLELSDAAVLFLNDDPDQSVVKVLPVGDENQDLVPLVTDIVRIQALSRGQQVDAWLAYLANGERTSQIEVALRSLLANKIEWNKLAPSMSTMMHNSSNSPASRAFAFGAVSFGLTLGIWKGDSIAVTDFLCRTFAAESNESQALQYVLHLKQILRATELDKFGKEGEPVRKQILRCLHETRAQGPDVEVQYKDIFSRYPL